MPRGKTISADEMKKELDKYRAMGGGFVTVVQETEEALSDLQPVEATADDLKKTIKKNLARLEAAAGVLGGGK